jgi:hypothetical protein
MYTNYEGYDVDIGDVGDGEGDVSIDDEDETYPHAKGVPVMMIVSNSPRW